VCGHRRGWVRYKVGELTFSGVLQGAAGGSVSTGAVK
jgi:hypothetical protein